MSSSFSVTQVWKAVCRSKGCIPPVRKCGPYKELSQEKIQEWKGGLKGRKAKIKIKIQNSKFPKRVGGRKKEGDPHHRFVEVFNEQSYEQSTLGQKRSHLKAYIMYLREVYLVVVEESNLNMYKTWLMMIAEHGTGKNTLVMYNATISRFLLHLGCISVEDVISQRYVNVVSDAKRLAEKMEDSQAPPISNTDMMMLNDFYKMILAFNIVTCVRFNTLVNIQKQDIWRTKVVKEGIEIEAIKVNLKKLKYIPDEGRFATIHCSCNWNDIRKLCLVHSKRKVEGCFPVNGAGYKKQLAKLGAGLHSPRITAAILLERAIMYFQIDVDWSIIYKMFMWNWNKSAKGSKLAIWKRYIRNAGEYYFVNFNADVEIALQTAIGVYGECYSKM